jgi:hypothetical protein
MYRRRFVAEVAKSIIGTYQSAMNFFGLLIDFL